ncbi:hypothetical protein J1F21_12405 [Aeromonas veronii]|uniref:hypothetical protein n=1 Tax=Aeromonas veronii TaxID=654 RepID=UPI001A900218|nr:hypothetical protein [Aeromonas veronii]MBO0399104.1 hypothetical protein [Aeromonas veronii]
MKKTVHGLRIESAAKARLLEQVRNKNEVVTILSGSKATLAYPFHPAWLPPLNFSFQSAAFHQRDGVGMAHGRLRRGNCCQMAILTMALWGENSILRISVQDQ